MDFFYMYGANGVFKKVMVERYEDAGAPPPPPDTEDVKKNKKKIDNIKTYDELKNKYGTGFMVRGANDMGEVLKDVIKKIKETVALGVDMMDKIEAPRKRALLAAKSNKQLKENRENQKKAKRERKQKEKEDRASAKKKEENDRVAKQKKEAEERAKSGGEDATQKAFREKREQDEKAAREAKESADQKARDEQDAKDKEAQDKDDEEFQKDSSAKLELVMKEYQSSEIPLSKLDDFIKDAESAMNDQLTLSRMDMLESFRSFCEKAFNPPDVSESDIPNILAQLKGGLDPDDVFITGSNYKYYYYKSYMVAQDVKYVKANMEKLRGFKENYEKKGISDMSEIRSSF